MPIHNEAKKEDIARIVIMPGDPNRATYIAQTYLKDYKLVNNIRGMKAYTGYYEDKRITVMAHGMGMPSASIYVYELFNFYDVDIIIRIGSAGSYDRRYSLGDIILTKTVYSPSNITKYISGCDSSIINSYQEINDVIKDTSKNININIKEANVTTTDIFEPYFKEFSYTNNVEVAEMETYIIFLLAKKFNKKCASLLTISDENYSDNIISPEDREKKMNKMIELALSSALNL